MRETGVAIDGVATRLVVERSSECMNTQGKKSEKKGQQLLAFLGARRGGFYMRVRDSEGQVLYAQEE